MDMKSAERAVSKLLNDSKELEFLRDECAALSWQNVELGSLVAALRRALSQTLEFIKTEDSMQKEEWDRLYDLASSSAAETCSCGHLMVDHDKRGCCWLHCKPICGKDVD
jgi:hypothetical protein